MAYDLHITRAPEDWSENDGFEISAEEWRQVAKTDEALVPDAQNGEHFFVVPGIREDGGDAWFDWSVGNIDTNGVDRPTLRKMMELATKLGARVQGDDGEYYSSDADLT